MDQVSNSHWTGKAPFLHLVTCLSFKSMKKIVVALLNNCLKGASLQDNRGKSAFILTVIDDSLMCTPVVLGY